MVPSRGPLEKIFGLKNPLWEISGPREIDFSAGYSQAAVWAGERKIASPKPFIFWPRLMISTGNIVFCEKIPESLFQEGSIDLR